MSDQQKPKFNFDSVKSTFSRIPYQDLLMRGRMYCLTPRSIFGASIVAATSWNIHANKSVKPIFENPLSSIVGIGIVACITNFFATAISECLHNGTKQIVPIVLFGSSAYHLTNTYIRPQPVQQKCLRIEFGDNKKYEQINKKSNLAE